MKKSHPTLGELLRDIIGRQDWPWGIYYNWKDARAEIKEMADAARAEIDAKLGFAEPF